MDQVKREQRGTVLKNSFYGGGVSTKGSWLQLEGLN